MDSLENVNQDTAKKLFAEGAFFIFLNVPIGTLFGMDLTPFHTGEKFKGVKMIPPGIHYIYFSAVGKHGDVAPRVSFMHDFKKSEILVKKWNTDTEDISDEVVSEEEIERFRANLLDLDKFLAPYSLSKDYTNWKKLSYRITGNVVKRLMPECGLIRSALELVKGKPKTPTRRTRVRTVEEKEEDLLPNLVPKDGTSLRVTDIPEAFPEGSSPAEITKHCMDSTYTLEKISSGVENDMEILGELQFCYICFFLGHSMEALGSWISLFKTLCRVRIGLTRKTAFYSSFLKTLETQLAFVPTEFLVDIVSSNNAIYDSLKELFRSFQEVPGVEPRLKCEAERLKDRVAAKYNWNFENLEEEEGEDAPVIVEVPES